MTIQELLQTSAIVLGVAVAVSVLIGNIYYVIRSKTGKLQKENIEQQDILIADLTKKFEHCQEDHKTSLTMIHRLQGQIDVLKDIPLKDINKDIGSIKKTNEKILKTLQDSENVQEKIHRVQKEASA